MVLMVLAVRCDATHTETHTHTHTHLSAPTQIPPYRETSIAIPLSHCVSGGIADYRCYTPASFLKKMAYLSPKTDLTRVALLSQRKLASEAYRAIWGRRMK